MLRRNISVILLASFISIAVFGFVAMGEGYGHSHSGCIAATAGGVRGCQDSGEGAETLLFHLRTFKSFSQALGISILALAILCLVALAGLIRTIAETRSTLGHPFYITDTGLTARIYQKTRARIIYWLALHESRADGMLTGA